MNIKKIILLLIIIFPKVVYASEYYKIEGTCIESETCKKEEIIKYNTYSLNYVDMGYIEENSDYLKDENDYIEIESDEYITVHTNEKKVSTIFFTYLDTSFKIYELEIYNNEELIEYTPFLNYYVQFPQKLYDKDLNTYYRHGHSGSYLVLNLNKEYNLEDLKIRIYTKSEEDTFTTINTGGKIDLTNNIDRWHIITFKSDNLDTVEQEIMYYKKYRYYKEEKIINNIYLSDGDNLIEDDYIFDYIYYQKYDVSNNNQIISSNIDLINNNNKNLEKTNDNEKLIKNEILENNENNYVTVGEPKEMIIFEKDNSYNLESNNVIDKKQEDNDIDNKNITKKDRNLNVKKETVKKTCKFRIIISILLIIIDFIIVLIKRKKNKVESI